MDYLILPQASDIRAARVYLNWKQMDFAYKCGVSVATVTSIENEKSKPTKELLETISRVFMEEDIRFLPKGGFKVERDVVTVYEGEDCYSKVLDNVLQTMEKCEHCKKEAFFLGIDDRRSGEDVKKKKVRLYERGIACKHLLSLDNDYFYGPPEDYRQVDQSYFFSNDAVVIYDNKFVITFIDEETKNYKAIVINHEDMAVQMKKYFNALWIKGKEVGKSAAKQIYFKK